MNTERNVQGGENDEENEKGRDGEDDEKHERDDAAGISWSLNDLMR